MFTIKTEYKTAANGGGRITAKGRGKQRTTPYDHAISVEANHARAAGVLGNLVMSSVEQAKVHHPSGRQRVTIDLDNGAGTVTIDV